MLAITEETEQPPYRGSWTANHNFANL